MRPLACLAATALLLGGCHYASSPLVGFGGFVGDTHVFNGNPNLPPGSAETMRRVEGQQVLAEPLQPEAGNIWPGQPTAEPTLEDVIRSDQSDPGISGQGGAQGGGQGGVPAGSAAHPQPRGSGTSPGSVPLRSQPSAPAAVQPAPPSLRVPPATIDTQGGPQVLNRGGNGITTTTTPGGGTSIVVPNGNGTSTIIGPDGSTQTVPTPR